MELDLEEQVGKSRFFRTTRDLSVFGLSTLQGATHPKGTRLKLLVHLPDDLQSPLRLTAEVVGLHSQGRGMRLAFRSPPADAVRRIGRYLKSRAA